MGLIPSFPKMIKFLYSKITLSLDYFIYRVIHPYFSIYNKFILIFEILKYIFKELSSS